MCSYTLISPKRASELAAGSVQHGHSPWGQRELRRSSKGEASEAFGSHLFFFPGRCQHSFDRLLQVVFEDRYPNREDSWALMHIGVIVAPLIGGRRAFLRLNAAHRSSRRLPLSNIPSADPRRKLEEGLNIGIYAASTIYSPCSSSNQVGRNWSAACVFRHVRRSSRSRSTSCAHVRIPSLVRAATCAAPRRSSRAEVTYRQGIPHPGCRRG